MVRLDPVDEKLHSNLRSLLIELQRTLTPLSETYVTIEVHLRALMDTLDEPNPTTTVALLGMVGSGKSALLNSVMRCEAVLPPHTIHSIKIRPALVSGGGGGNPDISQSMMMDSHASMSESAGGSGVAAARYHRQMMMLKSGGGGVGASGSNRLGASGSMAGSVSGVTTTAGEEPFIRLRTGRAVAKGVEGCRDHLLSENVQFLKELSDRYLSVSLPILAEEDIQEAPLSEDSSLSKSPSSGAQQHDGGSLAASHAGSAVHSSSFVPKRSLMFWAADVNYLDCSDDMCSYALQPSTVAMQVRNPNILSADVLWNCVDARLVARVIETLLPPEESVYRWFEDTNANISNSASSAFQTPDYLPKSSSERFNDMVDTGRRFNTKEEAADALNGIFYHIFSRCNDDGVSVEGTIQRVLRLTTFILTHIDSLLQEGQGRVRTIECSERAALYEEPVKAAVRDGFCKLFHLASGGALSIQKSRVLFFSAPTVATTLSLLSSNNPSIKDIYDFAEVNKGLGFMQTIDDVEEVQLRRIIRKLASDEIYVKSGAKAIQDAMRLVDYNSARHWMRRIACNGAECVEQLKSAVVAARPIILRQLDTAKSDLGVLLKELEWSVSSAQRVKQFCTKTLIESLVTYSNGELDRFLAGRLEELRYVLEHRELAWFKERQASTITDMNAKLRKLEAFTDRYMVQRGFLEKKQELLFESGGAAFGGGGGGGLGSDRDDDSINNCESSDSFSVNGGSRVSGSEANNDTKSTLDGTAMSRIEKRIARMRQLNSNTTTVEPSVIIGTSNFLEGNIDGLLDTMEREKEDHLTNFYLCFCHHIRDEYLHFVPTLLEGLQVEKDKLIHRLKVIIDEPIGEAEERLDLSFDTEGVFEELEFTNLVEENGRRLNSFLRELPGHAAAAAVEISNQWYTPIDSVTVKGVDVTLPLGGANNKSTATKVLRNNPIPPAFNNQEGDENAGAGYRGSSSLTDAAIDASGPATIGQGGRVSGRRQALFPAKPAPLPRDPNREEHHVVHPHLLYVYECWRVTFDALELHQLSNYNVHNLTLTATEVNNAVVDFINMYVENIESGASSHKSHISEFEAAEDMISSTVEICEDLSERFEELLDSLDRAVVGDVSTARRLANEIGHE